MWEIKGGSGFSPHFFLKGHQEIAAISLLWIKLNIQRDLTDNRVGISKDEVVRNVSCLSLFLRTDTQPWTTACWRHPPTPRQWAEPSTSEQKPREHIIPL